MHRLTRLAAAALLAGAAIHSPAFAQYDGDRAPTASTSATERPLYLVNKDKDGLAVQGYDVVAFFTDNQPVKGDPRHRANWGGATYQFVSKEHKEQFEADPERFAPLYGGYCAYAASINKLSPIDPKFFEIVDGRLILQHNQKAWDLWKEAPSDNMRKAQANWPTLVAKNAKPAKNLVNVDRSGVAVQGYDVVAYFTDNRPAKGSAEHMAIYNGATYHFASKANKDTFELDPAKYEPQFGGFCAYAASINKVSPIDPKHFQIEDGRLLLQHTQDAFDKFNKNPRANLARADKNWPGLVERKGK